MQIITISNNNGADYCCIINGIGKKEAINLLKYVDYTAKSGVL